MLMGLSRGKLPLVTARRGKNRIRVVGMNMIKNVNCLRLCMEEKTFLEKWVFLDLEENGKIPRKVEVGKW